MKTIHLHAGTGLRVVTCLMSELNPKYHFEPGQTFAVFSFGWGVIAPSQEQSQTAKKDLRARLVFDTRFLDNLIQDGDATYMLGKDLCVLLHPVAQAVNAALVVDLGNTRSFGLLLDDVNHASEMRIHPLQIREYSSWTDSHTTNGVFASHVCLEKTPPFDHPELPPTQNRFGRPLSGIRTGEAARSLMLQISEFDQQPSGRVAQVSPKRFFWDHDPVRFKWKAGSVAEKRCVEPEGVLYDAWLKDRRITSETMPPSTLIGAMVIEMFDQAEMQLNQLASGAGHVADGPRRIRDIVITYPPAWSLLEKESYRSTIVKHLDAYCDERGFPHVTVRIACDEATGTLLAYISNEVEKFGGNLTEWITSVGSVDAFGNGQARFAVLDVGGGTSDLVMADVSIMKQQYGIHHLQIKRFHQDGVLIAGDELLRKIAARIVLPAVAEAMIPEDKERRARFFNFLVSQPTEHVQLKQWRCRWALQLWYPLALQVVQAWQNGGKVVLSQDINACLDGFCDNCVSVITGSASIMSAMQLERVSFKGLGASTEKANNGAIAAKFNAMAPDAGKVKEICSEVFKDASIRFGTPIALAGCDRVLLSGKTTEFKFVREALTQHIPLPAFKFISFENYKLAPLWVSSAGKNGTNILGDVKMTTVIGAALEYCADKGVSVFGLASKPVISDAHLFSDSQQYWGIVPSAAVVPSFSNDDAVFSPGDGVQRKQVPVQFQSLLLARRRTKIEGMTAQIAYELRVNPKLAATPNGMAEIERIVNPNGTVELQLAGVVSGGVLTHATGERVNLKKEHLELRQMVAQNSDFWISEGNLHEQIPW